MNIKISRVIITFLIFVILITNIVIAQNEENYTKKVVVYFTSLDCKNCAVTDPEVLGEWTKKYPDLVIIEYVFEKWTDENALLLGKYSKKYKSMSAVPNLFINENKSYLGKINVLEAEKEFDSINNNSILLLENSVSLEKLNFNELLCKPKLWTDKRVLIKIGNKEISNDFLRNLLFAENLENIIKNSEYKITEINPEAIPISNGEILFENAINIENSWILEFNNEINFDLIEENKNSIDIPLIGDINLSNLSLPFITILIGLADGFNPCAFFILTLLLATMLYASSSTKEKSERRKRLAIVGGIFIFFSGLIYLLFMTLWLNVFLYAKQIIFLTIITGCIAIFAGLVNIKDYFYFKKGISLTLPKKQKNNLENRLKRLIKVKSLWALLFGTIIIAATVNLYELLCTVGFPMVYLGTLTTKELSSLSYFLYLLLYNLFYVLPLTIIVIIFVGTLSAKEFSKRNVQRLKLISGFMILFLGLILIFKPELLENIVFPFLTILIAIFISLGIIYYNEFRKV
jgi:cytochrome c biogenesis protein CcdA